MAALAGLNTTTAEELIRAEQIDPDVIMAPSIVRCWEGFTWQRDASKGNSEKYRFVAVDDATVSGTKTESDELAASNFGATAAEATAAVVGRRYFISDEGNQDVIVEAVGLAANDLADKVRNRVDKDVLALASGATNSSDFTGEELNLDNFEEALALFEAQNPNLARIVFVGGSGQIAHLRKSIRTSGNGGLIQGLGLDVFAGRVNSAYQGNWGKVEIWRGNVPDANVSDASGMFVACDAPGGKSGLGLAAWWPVRGATERIESRVGLDVVVTSRYGTVITAQFLVREVITKKAAA